MKTFVIMQEVKDLKKRKNVKKYNYAKKAKEDCMKWGFI